MSADSSYRNWLRKKRTTVPLEVVRPWAMELMERHETIDDIEALTGVIPRRIYAICHRTYPSVSYDVAEKLAAACGEFRALAEAAPVGGKEGWSEVGRSCGDGAGRYDGCGTFFHKHYKAGLCEECFGRECLGMGPAEPRDVRVSREVMSCAS